MQLIENLIIHTPIWVYLIFFLLIYLGIKATKTSVMPFRRVFIAPIVFSYISITGISRHFEMNSMSIITAIVALIIGYLLGHLTTRKIIVKIDKKNKRIQLPGNYWTLIITMIIFSTKYFFAYKFIRHPELKQASYFLASYIFISTLIIGFLIGRLTCFILKYKSQKHEDF
jgi:tetrahydromethanopterin S-methyltransferase subunit C